MNLWQYNRLSVLGLCLMPILLLAQAKVQPFDELSAWQIFRPGVYILADRQANLYLCDSSGWLLEQSLPLRVHIDKIECRTGVQCLLFSAEAQQLFFIDRFLRTKQHIRIPFELGNISQLAWAPDNWLWLWDEQAHRLLRWDMRAVVQELAWQSLLVGKHLPQPVAMFFLRNYLFLLLKDKQMLVFDLLGNFVQQLTLPIAPRIAGKDGQRLWIANDDELWVYEWDRASWQALPRSKCPNKKIEDMLLDSNQLLIWDGEQIKFCGL